MKSKWIWVQPVLFSFFGGFAQRDSKDWAGKFFAEHFAGFEWKPILERKPIQFDYDVSTDKFHWQGHGKQRDEMPFFNLR